MWSSFLCPRSSSSQSSYGDECCRFLHPLPAATDLDLQMSGGQQHLSMLLLQRRHVCRGVVCCLALLITQASLSGHQLQLLHLSAAAGTGCRQHQLLLSGQEMVIISSCPWLAPLLAVANAVSGPGFLFLPAHLPFFSPGIPQWPGIQKILFLLFLLTFCRALVSVRRS